MTYDTRQYLTYIDGVLNDSINSCKAIKQACQRFKDFLKRDDMWFDYEDVDRRINFIYLMKHSTGSHNGKPFELLPWQQFVMAGIFGFKWKSSNLRVTRNVFIFCSRKNGKTALASAIILSTLICDKEQGAEMYCVANNTKQASIALTQTMNFAESIDPKGKFFKQYRSEIKIPRMKSTINVLSGDAMGNDGYNPNVAIIDEIHAAKDFGNYEIMKSGMGMRDQPLLITITTSGFLVGEEYPCYSMWNYCHDILDGKQSDDSQFSAIYELDPEDDWHDRDVWIKATPSLGQTVKYEYMEERVNTADSSTLQKPLILTKNFNIWDKSLKAWFTMDTLDKATQRFDLSLFSDNDYRTAYVGIDLAAVSDLTCVGMMVQHEDKFYFKVWYFLPEDTIKNCVNSDLYKAWHRQGYLLTTPGNVTDYDYILQKLIQINDEIPIYKVAYDTWNATQFAVSATEAGMPMQPFSQAIGNFNRATKEFERLMLGGKIVLDDNPITRWCFSNVDLKYDANENCKPVKGGTKMDKIDGVIAILESLGVYLYEVAPEASLEMI